MSFDSIKNHPFAVEAYFKKSIVLTFAFLKENLEKFIPPCLSLDVYYEKWAFIAVAIVDTKDLRPKGFHRNLGNNFWLIGVRIFVTYTNNKGKRLRGLYILKSETNKFLMQLFGNIFTHYNYTTTDIVFKQTKNGFQINSQKSDIFIDVNSNIVNPTLPEKSIFPDWKTARRYAGPLPFTFSYNEVNNEILIIEGVRENWQPKPIEISNFRINYFSEFGLGDAIFSNAFIIEEIPYLWKKGYIEKVMNEKAI